MGIYDKNIRNNNGISYSKEVDGPSDWINIESETYFKDLSDSLIYYKNSNDIVISIFEEAGITSADNGLNISTSDDIELGGTLNKDTDINGNNKTLNLGTLTDALNGININSITSTRTHTFPGFDSITSEYTPGNLTINSVSLSGDQTHQNITTPSQYRREISDISTNVTSYINLQDQLTFNSENTSTLQGSNLLFSTNQTSLSHSSGSGTSNVFTQTDLQTSLYYSGNTQNGIIITGDTINLYGPETNIDLNISGSIFTDNRISGSTKGLEYGDDYHLGFTDRTLVDKAYVDDAIVNNITGSAGAGLTFNTTTNQIDLGGKLDNGTPANNIRLYPSVGANQVKWGIKLNDAETSEVMPANADGSNHYYISHFEYWSFVGYRNVIGLFGQGSYGYGSGPQLGCLESQGSTTYYKYYKDVAQMTNSAGHIQGFPGGSNELLTFYEADSPTQKLLQIWESSGSNTNSKTTQTFDKFQWTVDNTAGHSARQRLGSSYADIIIPNADNSQQAMFLMMPGALYWKDGQGLGLTTVPDGTWIGGVATSSNTESRLVIGLGTADTYFFTGSNSNNRGIKYKGFGETDTETGVDADYTTLVGTSLVPKKYVDDSILDINTIYNNDDSLTGDRIVNLDNNSLTFDIGTLTSGTNNTLGLIIDGSNIYYGGGSISSPLLQVEGELGNILNINSGGYLFCTSDYNDSIARFEKRGTNKGFGVGASKNTSGVQTVQHKPLLNSPSTKMFQQTVSNSLIDWQISFDTGTTGISNPNIQHWIRYGDAAAQVSFFRNGIGSSNFKVGGASLIGTEDISLQGDTLISGKLELSTTTDGILLPRLDTNEMNLISSPDTHLVIFNTDLNALYRYNGTAWVAMSAGYGIIEVKDSAGNPTFYAHFKSAFDSIGGNGVITIHSDILIDDTTEESVLDIDNTITINGNGHTITHTCNTGDDFAFINSVSGSSKIYLNNVKIISNGTAGGSGSYVATLFGGISSSPSLIQCSEDTYIEATNNNICELTTIRGGTLVATNGKVCFSGAVENAKVTTKTTRSDFRNCHIQILTGGEMSQTANEIIGNIIEGDAVSNNLITLNANLKFWDNTVICSSGTNNCIEIDSGSPGSYIDIQNCKIYNYGTGDGIKATYIHVMKDVYVYSEGEGIYTQNTFVPLASEYNMENVTTVTNSTNKNAFNRVDGSNDFKMKNVIANNINPSNTEEAMNIRVSAGLTLYMEDCVANVANPVVDNLRLSNNNITTGGAYIYGLRMSKIGTGLNLNTVPLLNINTPDSYGNLKIG